MAEKLLNKHRLAKYFKVLPKTQENNSADIEKSASTNRD